MKSTTIFLIMALFSVGLLAQDTKSPLPSADDIKSAMTTVKDVFKDEYKNLKTADDRKALAKKLIEQAADPANNPAMAYSLISESARIAGDAGDISTVSDASKLFAGKFEGDSLPIRIKMFESAEKASSKLGTESLSALAEEYLKLADEAISADDFSTVTALCANADRTAKKAKNTALVSKAADKKKDAADALNGLKNVSAAIEKLKASPDDPGANFAVGKYTCFSKGDWDRGLPMLAKGSDKDYKETAELDLAAKDTASTMLSADKWWNLADKEKSKTAKSAIMSHAAEKYQKIIGELGGIEKTKAEKRIEALDNPNKGKEMWISKDAQCKLSSTAYCGFMPDFLTCENVRDFSLHTANGGEQWCVVELKKVFTITKVEVKNRLSSCKNRIVGAQLLFSKDGKSWAKIGTFADAKDDYEFKFKNGKIAKFIKILQTNGEHMNLSNFKAFGY